MRDALLSVGAAGLFRPVWQEEIEDEVRRNSIKLAVKRGNDQDEATKGADRVKAAMNKAFPGACLEKRDWVKYMRVCTNHPKDRHVLAAALGGGATHVVTSNVKDFPVASRPPGVAVVRPDTFMLSLLQGDPDGVVGAIEEMAARHKAPPHTSRELADIMAAGELLPRFGAALGQVLA